MSTSVGPLTPIRAVVGRADAAARRGLGVAVLALAVLAVAVLALAVLAVAPSTRSRSAVPSPTAPQARSKEATMAVETLTTSAAGGAR